MRFREAVPSLAVPSGRYRGLLRESEFVGLLGSRWVSVVGDQVARVALTVLVFDRTRDALLAAVAFGATIVPGAFAPLVSGIADRWPRRRVLIVGDLVRAALLGLMALPGVPWGVLTALVAVVTLVEGPRDAARMPLLRTVLVDEEAFRRGTALDEMTEQPGQILGFLLAGALLVVADPRVALVIDALSFLLSALVVRILVAHRGAAAEHGGSVPRGFRDAFARGVSDARIGFAVAFEPARRRPLLLCWVAASAALAPDVLVAPWAAQIHAGSFGIGLLLAVPSAAVFLALPLVGRIDTAGADRATSLLVVLALAPLMFCGLAPALPAALVLVALGGAGTTFTVLSRVSFMAGLPDDVSGRAYSVASGGLCAGQGLCVILAGALGNAFGAGPAIAIVGAGALAVSAGVVVATRRPGPLNAGVPPIGSASAPAAPRRVLDLSDRRRIAAFDGDGVRDAPIASLR